MFDVQSMDVGLVDQDEAQGYKMQMQTCSYFLHV